MLFLQKHLFFIHAVADLKKIIKVTELAVHSFYLHYKKSFV